ncbi:S8 family serine peptidase [Vibrio sp. NTOU-M3]|uniref:S8 family serine peptidase n=1 Tax=Vibrio sp. NTOU-M3 TaxID=3234954 RepID=UPI00349FC3D9
MIKYFPYMVIPFACCAHAQQVTPSSQPIPIDITQENATERYDNRIGQHQIGVDALKKEGRLGFTYDGSNAVGMHWEDGWVPLDNPEFSDKNGISRLTLIGPPKQPTDEVRAGHAASMALLAAGKGSQQFPFSEGVAPNAQMYSGHGTTREFLNWLTDPNNADKENLASSHSYGPGLDIPLAEIGSYQAREYDNALYYSAPKHVYAHSAGNFDGHTADGSYRPYFWMVPANTTKNGLVVGAAGKTEEGENIQWLGSAKGPLQDGRIKPDLVTTMYSQVAIDDDDTPAYFQIDNGATSSASPQISGSVLLLQEVAKDFEGASLYSASIRGLLLHTAKNSLLKYLNNDKPNYSSGWGLAQVDKAAEIILNNGHHSFIKELTISKSSPEYRQEFEVTAGKDVSFSISWNDVPGPSNDISSNKCTEEYIYEYGGADLCNYPAISSDLDIEVIDPEGIVHKPWKLDPANPSFAATQGDNNVDVFEKVDIANAKAGTYTVIVKYDETHPNYHTSYSQEEVDFSLIGTGLSKKTNTPEWQANESYTYGDIVYFAGVEYFAVADSNPALNPFKTKGEMWKPLNIVGASCEQFDSFRSGDTYTQYSSVRYNNKVYVAIKDVTNTELTPDNNLDEWIARGTCAASVSRDIDK